MFKTKEFLSLFEEQKKCIFFISKYLLENIQWYKYDNPHLPHTKEYFEYLKHENSRMETFEKKFINKYLLDGFDFFEHIHWIEYKKANGMNKNITGSKSLFSYLNSLKRSDSPLTITLHKSPITDDQWEQRCLYQVYKFLNFLYFETIKEEQIREPKIEQYLTEMYQGILKIEALLKGKSWLFFKYTKLFSFFLRTKNDKYAPTSDFSHTDYLYFKFYDATKNKADFTEVYQKILNDFLSIVDDIDLKFSKDKKNKIDITSKPEYLTSIGENFSVKKKEDGTLIIINHKNNSNKSLTGQLCKLLRCLIEKQGRFVPTVNISKETKIKKKLISRNISKLRKEYFDDENAKIIKHETYSGEGGFILNK